ncbi:unnamed protein product [Cuscuta campestris]|uniref:MBD domain-containing protein n=1 Tax=Cuscuta campestris TaxID=132261 RepID=A0A484L0H1_9ASTE|nr:unnamed protein product [Cuscuta campestris]
MVAGKSQEPLPPGWIEHEKVKNGRTTKYYTNSDSGKKFYSKKAVLDYTKARDAFHDQIQGVNNNESGNQEVGNDDGQHQGISNGDGQHQGISNDDGQNQGINEDENATPSLKPTPKSDKSLEVPPGWTVELKTRMGSSHNGGTYKCYISPSGRKFYSKVKVSQYLNSTGNSNNSIDHGKKDNIEGSISNVPVSQDHTPNQSKGHTSQELKSDPNKDTPKTVSSAVTAHDGSVDGLPAGWIKEVRSKTCPSGIRKDPFYIDPVSGYEFRSKKDVLRYLETGDINKCAMKPKKRDPESASKDIPQNIEESSAKQEEPQNHHTPVKDNGQPARTPRKQKSGTEMRPTEIVSSDAVQNDAVDELPPGWIKEYKSRRSGKKDPFYTDSASGYMFRSKKDALRYIESGDISKCAMKPLKKELGSTLGDTPPATENSSPKLRVSQNEKALKAKRAISKKRKSSIHKRTPKALTNVPVQSGPADGLPPGWTREFRLRQNPQGSRIIGDAFYIDPVSGYEFRSKKDVMRYLDTGDIGKCVVKPTKRDPESATKDKPILHDVVEASDPKLEDSQNNTPAKDPSPIPKQLESTPMQIGVQSEPVDGLPSGWIKEAKTRMTQAGEIRHDWYYVDPVSGYEFRSKKDALRYIESGDIRKCIIRPSKRIPGSTPNSVPPNPETDSWTRREVFVGEELKGNENTGAEIKESSAPTDAAVPQPHAEEGGSNKRRRSITHDYLNANSGTGISVGKLPPRRKSNKVSGNQSPSSGQTATKTRNPRENKGPTSLPGRASNRLAEKHKGEAANLGHHDGIEPDKSLDPSEKLVSNVGIGPEGSVVIPNSSSGIDINTSWGPHDPVRQVVADLGLGEEEILQSSAVGSGEIDVNTAMAHLPRHFSCAASKPPSEVYVGPHDDVDVNIPLPSNPQTQFRGSGDCWTDPCLDFALKTLTGGGMPAGEGSQDQTCGGVQHQQQQQQPQPFDPPYPQVVDGCFSLPLPLPVFDSQSGPQHPSSMMNSSPLLPPGFSLPSYNGMGSQSGPDGRKDYPPPNL